MSQSGTRSVDQGRKNISRSSENGKGMGKRHFAECSLVRREDLLPESGVGTHRTTRLEANLREAVPRQRRGVGADSVPARACLRADNGAVSGLQTEPGEPGE